MTRMLTGTAFVLGIAFIILRLGGVITWSWWWVLSPYWGLAVLTIFQWVIAFAVAFILDYREIGWQQGRRGRKVRR